MVGYRQIEVSHKARGSIEERGINLAKLIPSRSSELGKDVRDARENICGDGKIERGYVRNDFVS